jgi:hypothetical protein
MKTVFISIFIYPTDNYVTYCKIMFFCTTSVDRTKRWSICGTSLNVLLNCVVYLEARCTMEYTFKSINSPEGQKC